MQSTPTIQQFNALLQADEPGPLFISLRQLTLQARPHDIRQLSDTPQQREGPVDPQVTWTGWAW